jgi:hypothetical protein
LLLARDELVVWIGSFDRYAAKGKGGADAANWLSMFNAESIIVNAGIALAKWFKHEALRVYAMLDESETERDKRRLLDWIGRKGGTVTAREVQQGCRGLKDPGTAETAMDELTKAGRGAWQDVPPTAKGGRPARVFVLSTLSGVYETSLKPDGN